MTMIHLDDPNAPRPVRRSSASDTQMVTIPNSPSRVEYIYAGTDTATGSTVPDRDAMRLASQRSSHEDFINAANNRPRSRIQGLTYVETATTIVRLESILRRLEGVERTNEQNRAISAAWFTEQGSTVQDPTTRPGGNTPLILYCTAVVASWCFFILPSFTAFLISLHMVNQDPDSFQSALDTLSAILNRLRSQSFFA